MVQKGQLKLETGRTMYQKLDSSNTFSVQNLSTEIKNNYFRTMLTAVMCQSHQLCDILESN